jgi:hypothetical protein
MIIFDLEDFLYWYKDVAKDTLHKLGDAGEQDAKASQDPDEN